jgi:hypothetical protein
VAKIITRALFQSESCCVHFYADSILESQYSHEGVELPELYIQTPSEMRSVATNLANKQLQQ